MISVVQFSSVTQSLLTLCDTMDCSTPGLPVHHQLLGLAQTHVHQVSDAIQPSHPLSYPSPPGFNLSQHQGLVQWVSSSHQMAKVLEFQLQHQSFQRIFRINRMDWLDLLAVQETLQSLLQPHSSKTSVLCIRWPKYWSFSFRTSPSNEYSGLISFRMDCWISLQSKGLSRVFSNTTVQKHQFFCTQPSL